MRKVSKVRQSKFSGWIAYVFFGIFALVGIIATYFMTWRPTMLILAAKSWEETTCVITSSEVAVNRGSDSTTYSVDIRYTYEAEWGETYQGDRYDFSLGSSSGYESKARVVEAHPPGSEVTCYVDPKDPSKAVINRKAGLFMLWGLFPLPFLLVGLGGLTFLVSGGWAQKKVGSQLETEPFAVAEPPIPTGALELEAAASPTAKLMGMGCFALIWNGVVSVFVFGVILPSFRQEDPEWFLTLFMIPFVLIGLGTIGGVVYQFLATFNPRPRLRLAEGHLTPGGDSSLSWEFSGQASRLQSLTLELEGRESARYRRGTNTYTDHHVFFTNQLASEEGRFGAIARGSTTLEIPRRTMPSFEATNNRIEWRIKVHGDIPFWPDVNDSFPITVYPGEGENR